MSDCRAKVVGGRISFPSMNTDDPSAAETYDYYDRVGGEWIDERHQPIVGPAAYDKLVRNSHCSPADISNLQSEQARQLPQSNRPDSFARTIFETQMRSAKLTRDVASVGGAVVVGGAVASKVPGPAIVRIALGVVSAAASFFGIRSLFGDIDAAYNKAEEYAAQIEAINTGR